MEFLIIGAGLSGSVIARELAEYGHKVIIWERRPQIGGNMYDYIDKHGILVHAYGPHTFHTKSKVLYDYICKFAEWQPYHVKCGAEINGKFTPTPFNFKTIDDYFSENEAEELKQRIKRYYKNQNTATVLEVLNCDDSMIKSYAEFLFANDYSLYTSKQWGISPNKVDQSILKRVPLRFSYDEGYFDDEYQVMPKISYQQFFANLLNHSNIEIKLGIEALEHLTVDKSKNCILIDGKKCNKTVVYTGTLDELFRMDLGQLPYRSLRFEWHYEKIDSKQPYPVTAYPQAKGFTRITEYKKLPVQNVKGTSYAVEYPVHFEAGKQIEPYYPLLTEESQHMSKIYKERASKIENFFFCGRLSDYKYYNMDQALERALNLSRDIINGME